MCQSTAFLGTLHRYHGVHLLCSLNWGIRAKLDLKLPVSGPGFVRQDISLCTGPVMTGTLGAACRSSPPSSSWLSCHLIVLLYSLSSSLSACSVQNQGADCSTDSSLQPGLECCFVGVPCAAVLWQPWLSKSPSLPTGETRQQPHPQPFYNLIMALTVISCDAKRGKAPTLGLVWRCWGAPVRWEPFPGTAARWKVFMSGKAEGGRSSLLFFLIALPLLYSGKKLS